MNILKALERLPKLSDVQLEHLLQLIDNDIVNYKNAIVNYDERNMEKFGKPFLNILSDQKISVLDELIKRTDDPKWRHLKIKEVLSKS